MAPGVSTFGILLQYTDRASRGLYRLQMSLRGTQNAALGAVTQMTALQRLQLGGVLLGAGVAMVAPFGLATRAASAYQAEMLRVQKTTGFTNEMTEQMRKSYLGLSQQIPVTADELARIGAIGGQLGITSGLAPGKAIATLNDFSATIAKLGATTEINSEMAATGLAKLKLIFGENAGSFSEMGDALAKLEVMLPATAKEIIDVSRRAGPMLNLFKVSVKDTMAIAGGLVSVGAQTELAGSNIAKFFMEMATKAPKVAAFVGMSERSFRAILKNDPTQAMMLFLRQVQKLGGANSQLAIQQLSDMGFTSQRLLQVILGSAGGLDKFVSAIDAARNAGGTMDQQFRIITQGLDMRLKLLRNNFDALVKKVGAQLIPIVTKLVNGLIKMLQIVDKIPAPVLTAVVAVTALAGAFTALAGSVLIFRGGWALIRTAFPVLATGLPGITGMLARVGLNFGWIGRLLANFGPIGGIVLSVLVPMLVYFDRIGVTGPRAFSAIGFAVQRLGAYIDGLTHGSLGWLLRQLDKVITFFQVMHELDTGAGEIKRGTFKHMQALGMEGFMANVGSMRQNNMVGGADAKASRWVADKVLGLGGLKTAGGPAIVERYNPLRDPGQAARITEQRARLGKAAPTVVHTHVHLDGKEIHHSVKQAEADERSRRFEPPTNSGRGAAWRR